MIGHRGVIAALLTLVVAACDGTASASVQPVALESDADATVAVTVTATATASPAQTDSATPRPTPEPTPEPTPPPPPKPKGVTFEWHNEVIEGAPGDTDGIGDYILTVTWERPRTKGTHIRVYGVTKCFEPGASGVDDDSCLRKGTPLPSRLRVLVAKEPASMGTVTFRLPLGDQGGWAKDGRDIHSFVIAAYNDSGHSIFEIVDPGSYCASVRNCDTY